MISAPGDPPPRPSPHPAASICAWGMVLVALVAAAFWPILGNQFVNWDDDRGFLENSHLQDTIARQVAWAWTNFLIGVYQPLSWMVMEAEHACWGLDPRGFHAVSLLTHACQTLAVYALVVALVDACTPPAGRPDRRWVHAASATAAALYAVHPLRVEAVAWATIQATQFCAVLTVLSVWAFVKAQQAEGRSRVRLRRASLALYVAAFLCFPAPIGVPVALLALAVYLPGGSTKLRDLLREVGPYFAIAMPFTIVAFLAKGATGALMSVERLGPTARVLQACHNIWFYLAKTIWPFGLSTHYTIPRRVEILDPRFLLPLLATVAVSCLLVRMRKSLPGLLVLWVCYLAILAPNLGLAGHGNYFGADRYTYVAMIAPTAGFAYAVCRLTAPWRLATLAVAWVVVALLIPMARQQCRTWADSESLWRNVLKHQGPMDEVAQGNLGGSLLKQKKLHEAVAHLERAIKLDPRAVGTRLNLGAALEKLGRVTDAVAEYRKGLRLNPGEPELHHHLALALIRQGDPRAATAHFAAVARLRPDSSAAFHDLGLALADRGRFAEAADAFAESVRLRSDSAADRRNLGLVLAQLGRMREAREQLTAAVRLEPNSADAHFELGLILLDEGRRAEAAFQFSEAVRLRPNHPGARHELERIGPFRGQDQRSGNRVRQPGPPPVPVPAVTSPDGALPRQDRLRPPKVGY